MATETKTLRARRPRIDLLRVVEMAASGLKAKAIARAHGMTLEAWNTRIKNSPQLRAAFERGREMRAADLAEREAAQAQAVQAQIVEPTEEEKRAAERARREAEAKARRQKARQAVEQALTQQGRMTASGLRRATGLDYEAIYLALFDLTADGRVRKQEENLFDYYEVG